MWKPSPQANKLLTTLFITLTILFAFLISGFTLTQRATGSHFVPARGAFQLTNVIENGDFENFLRTEVATGWEPFNNGEAHYGWYIERWPEAVHSGKLAQLMEIYYTEKANRIIGIYQTVDVAPNAYYNLTLHALMRSTAPRVLRDEGDYEMAWGIDFRGRGDYYFVDDWITMPISEQLRLGSGGDDPVDNDKLYYQTFTGTIHTGQSRKISLFIRGRKVTRTGTEILFNVDDVSLVGPYYPPTPTPTLTTTETITETGTPTATVEPTASALEILLNVKPKTDSDDDSDSGGTTDTTQEESSANAPTGSDNTLPDAGAVRPPNIPLSVLGFSGLVLLVLGFGAMRAIWPKKPNKKLDKNEVLD